MIDPKRINVEAFQYYARLSRVKQYVEQNYSERITLEKVARIAGMEKKYFSAFFHRKVGVCFRQWLMWVRINEAKRQIEVGNHSITEIALATGFTDLRTFERSFKRCTGITARESKKEVGLCATNRTRIHDS